ncbi:unnamed protein product, partial [Discosporangium mesarthrocarpum]
MGTSSSKEDDRSAAGAISTGRSSLEQAEEAAELLAGAGKLSSKLQLSISCSDLTNMDMFGKSDPFVVIKLRSPPDVREWVEIGRTEVITNSLNPRFVTLIPLVYGFEEVQMITFEVYDADTGYNTTDTHGLVLSRQDFQGSASCAVAQLVGARGQMWKGKLL